MGIKTKINMEVNETAVAEYKTSGHSLVERAHQVKVRKFEDVMDAADILLDIKTFGESVTAKKEEITRPMNESLKAARKLFKPLEEMAAEAEGIVKGAILAFHERGWAKGKLNDNTINGLRGKVTLMERTQVRLIDEKAIPPEFCSPDTAKIEHALKAGITVPGAELIKTYGISAGKN